ncbi:hypothetical protein PTKIN_Ptkin10aG0113300 [Pterospermum kingtungense]
MKLRVAHWVKAKWPQGLPGISNIPSNINLVAVPFKSSKNRSTLSWSAPYWHGQI